jgi:hypothetical protein
MKAKNKSDDTNFDIGQSFFMTAAKIIEFTGSHLKK